VPDAPDSTPVVRARRATPPGTESRPSPELAGGGGRGPSILLEQLNEAGSRAQTVRSLRAARRKASVAQSDESFSFQDPSAARARQAPIPCRDIQRGCRCPIADCRRKGPHRAKLRGVQPSEAKPSDGWRVGRAGMAVVRDFVAESAAPGTRSQPCVRRLLRWGRHALTRANGTEGGATCERRRQRQVGVQSTLSSTTQAMKLGQVATDEGCLLLVRPAFQLSFARNRGFLGAVFLKVHECDREPLDGVSAATTLVMLLQSDLRVEGDPDVIGAVGAFKDVHVVGHSRSECTGRSTHASRRSPNVLAD
jgi:hypothetical protein